MRIPPLNAFSPLIRTVSGDPVKLAPLDADSHRTLFGTSKTLAIVANGALGSRTLTVTSTANLAVGDFIEWTGSGTAYRVESFVADTSIKLQKPLATAAVNVTLVAASYTDQTMSVGFNTQTSDPTRHALKMSFESDYLDPNGDRTSEWYVVYSQPANAGAVVSRPLMFVFNNATHRIHWGHLDVGEQGFAVAYDALGNHGGYTWLEQITRYYFREFLPTVVGGFHPITVITGGNPTVITAPGHGLTTGKEVVILDVQGNAPDLNRQRYAVTVIDGDNFSVSVNTTVAGHNEYGDGHARQMSWAMVPPSAGQMVVEEALGIGRTPRIGAKLEVDGNSYLSGRTIFSDGVVVNAPPVSTISLTTSQPNTKRQHVHFSNNNSGNCSIGLIDAICAIGIGQSTDSNFTEANSTISMHPANQTLGLGGATANSDSVVNIKGGTASKAPLRINSGPLKTTPLNGCFEYDGTSLYFTTGGVRRTVTLI